MKSSHVFKSAAAATLLITATVAQAAPAPVESRFNADTENWRVANLLSLSAASQAASFEAGTQRISTNDLFSWTVFAAPAKFLGNQSAFLGGSLSFDLSDSLKDTTADIFPTLVLQSGANLLAWFGGAPGSTMTSYSAVLTASPAWQKIVGYEVTGLPILAAASSADLSNVLGALQGIYINADWKTAGNDHAELDNVNLVGVVPEPSSWLMLLAGLAAVAIARRRP
ncbi:laminin B domain-containing protein [Roseateles toxinivorans]|uniref:Putative secreted protein with PEP-CTERM sorting signal n=1 Tax=Roseateles toxinivorans TaxID=270368 RepID=A0A4R6QSX7_9BURK|nr:laminin B domain-containing protein [Roseateles toxinivorans]TDP73258.1 putative secreted protein with PEP-CTERM sorting signal [Roseateles toxinivorans]